MEKPNIGIISNFHMQDERCKVQRKKQNARIIRDKMRLTFILKSNETKKKKLKQKVEI